MASKKLDKKRARLERKRNKLQKKLGKVEARLKKLLLKPESRETSTAGVAVARRKKPKTRSAKRTTIAGASTETLRMGDDAIAAEMSPLQ
jgi:hypothetical protein